MTLMYLKIIFTLVLINFLSILPMSLAQAGVKGIYLTQYSLENTKFLNYLIQNAKTAGVDTFIVDLESISSKYAKNIQLLKENNIHYVARIVMFPGGGTPAQVDNPDYWQRKYKLVQQAISLGAKSIQLDYIRYNTAQKPSSENAKRILNIIQWYKNKISNQNVLLEVDVFGIASFGESKYIGQNIKLFSQSIDAVCPMVYPSHYVPFAYHFKKPYDTIFNSLTSIQGQFDGKMPIKMYAYIELSNYHYPMSHEKTLEYIKAQISAVEDAGADGWYAWSPHNRYDNLFKVLRSAQGQQKQPAKSEPSEPPVQQVVQQTVQQQSTQSIVQQTALAETVQQPIQPPVQQTAQVH
jgi:hypothetical protein